MIGSLHALRQCDLYQTSNSMETDINPPRLGCFGQGLSRTGQVSIGPRSGDMSKALLEQGQVQCFDHYNVRYIYIICTLNSKLYVVHDASPFLFRSQNQIYIIFGQYRLCCVDIMRYDSCQLSLSSQHGVTSLYSRYLIIMYNA